MRVRVERRRETKRRERKWREERDANVYKYE